MTEIHEAMEFLLEEYRQVLEDERRQSNISWKLWSFYIIATGTSLATIFQYEAINLILPVSVTMMIIAPLVILLLYKSRRFSFVDFQRLCEIEQAAQNLSESELIGKRWCFEEFDRLFKKRYKYKLMGWVDAGLILTVFLAMVAWLILLIYQLPNVEFQPFPIGLIIGIALGFIIGFIIAFICIERPK